MASRKAWGQLLVAILTAIVAALTDSATGDNITDKEWIVIIGAGVGSFGVWVVPNMDAGIGHYAKTVVSFLTAGLAVLYVVIEGGLTSGEMIEVVLAGLAAIGVVAGVGNIGYRWATKRAGVSSNIVT